MGDFERGDRPRDHLYASELGYCPRAVWLGWNRPKPMDPEFTEKRGRLGHWIEDGMAVELHHYLVAREVSYRSDRVSGRVDYILRLPREFVRELVDAGFLTEDQFKKIKFVQRFTRTGKTLVLSPQIPLELKTTYAYERYSREPESAHLYQLGFYLTQMPDAPFGILRYYSLRSDTCGSIVDLLIPRDDAAVARKTDELWSVVHEPNEPPCRDPTDCFDCKKHDGRRDGPK